MMEKCALCSGNMLLDNLSNNSITRISPEEYHVLLLFLFFFCFVFFGQ